MSVLGQILKKCNLRISRALRNFKESIDPDGYAENLYPTRKSLGKHRDAYLNFAPSAYKPNDNKMYAAGGGVFLKNPVYLDISEEVENIINGDFSDGLNNWDVKGSNDNHGGVVVNSQLNINIATFSANATGQNVHGIDGKSYTFEFEIVSNTSGILQVLVGTDVNDIPEGTTGLYTVSGTFDIGLGSNHVVVFQSGSYTTAAVECVIDNVSLITEEQVQVPEPKNIEFTGQRLSEKTRINEQGVLETLAVNTFKPDYYLGVPRWNFEPFQAENLAKNSRFVGLGLNTLPTNWIIPDSIPAPGIDKVTSIVDVGYNALSMGGPIGPGAIATIIDLSDYEVGSVINLTVFLEEVSDYYPIQYFLKSWLEELQDGYPRNVKYYKNEIEVDRDHVIESGNYYTYSVLNNGYFDPPYIGEFMILGLTETRTVVSMPQVLVNTLVCSYIPTPENSTAVRNPDVFVESEDLTVFEEGTLVRDGFYQHLTRGTFKNASAWSNVNEYVLYRDIRIVDKSTESCFMFDFAGDVNIGLQGSGTVHWGDGDTSELNTPSSISVFSHVLEVHRNCTKITGTLTKIEFNTENSHDLCMLPNGLTSYINNAYNEVSGDLNHIPDSVTHFELTNGRNIYRSGSHNFNANMDYFLYNPIQGSGLTSSEVDTLLINLSNSFPSGGTIDLSYNSVRTNASDAAVAALEGRGVEILFRDRLIFTIDTSLAGSTAKDFTILTSGDEAYSYNVEDWGDGSSDELVSGDINHVYANDGVYQITISGFFPRFYFNNNADYKDMITSVDQWGDVGYSDNQTGAFYNCDNLENLAEDARWMDSITIGHSMFGSTGSLTTFPNVTLENLINGEGMFAYSALTAIPPTFTLTNLERGYHMFRRAGSLAGPIPEAMVLDNLTNGFYMFQDCELTSLPANMKLDNLTQAEYMFFRNPFNTTLPANMVLPNLINGREMFSSTGIDLNNVITLNSLTSVDKMFLYCNITTIPESLVPRLNSMLNGTSMFNNCNITSLPDSLTLAALTTGQAMFRNNNLTSISVNLSLSSLTNGIDMFLGNTINTEDYSNLLVNMEASNSNSNVSFDGGNSMYNESGGVARVALGARGWGIADGGSVPLPPSGPPSTEGIISRYTFEDNILDLQGGNHGTTNGVTYVTGLVGKAVEANEVKILEVPYDGSKSFGNGTTDTPFSISFMVKYDAIGNKQMLVGNLVGETREYYVYYDEDELRFRIFNEGGTIVYRSSYISNYSPVIGTWYHYIATYDGKVSMNLYQNGVSVGAQSEAGTYVAMQDVGQNITVGHYNDSGLRALPLTGAVDELIFWNRELSAQDAINLATAQLAGTDIGE